MRIAFATLISAAGLFAAETPYDLIRPVYPMEWSTAAVEDGGTVLSFGQFAVNKDDSLLGVPELGSKPADFKANGYISARMRWRAAACSASEMSPSAR